MEPTAILAPTPTLIPLPLDREAETYKVYIAAIQAWCSTGASIALEPDTPSHTMNVLLTDYEELAAEFKRNNPDSPPEFDHSTLEDYVRDESMDPFVINRDYDFGRPVEFMSEVEFESMVDDEGGYQEFFKSHPDHCGHMELSRVGFSTAGSQALVWTSGVAGEWCFGALMLLHKQDSQWVTAGEAVNYMC